MKQLPDTFDMDTMMALASWLEWAQAGGLADETIRSYWHELVDFFAWSKCPWESVNLTLLTAYSSTLSPGRSRIAYAALRNFQKWMVAAGVSTYDPGLELMPYRKQTKKVPSAFSMEELTMLRQGALTLGPRYRPVIDLLYMTGARAKELCGARFEDVTGSGLVIRQTKAKPGSSMRERMVPMSAAARACIDQLAEHRPPKNLMPEHIVGHGYVPMWRMVKETGLVARVPDTHPHRFRATFCTHLMQRGVDIRTISELAGHSSIATTMQYLATDDKRKQDAIALLG